ncbi:MAG TPA: Na+/H+ antiporter subunit E [Aggregatilineales bacterium]|nr:Na+/H+ antiporter subunit E [Anaerolineales bacterium]HRE46679.1 Na+/H+ antiporter subunit E [Aggregatilineales bacterium]
MRNLLLVNLLLALLWAAFQQLRPIDIVGGFIIGYLLLWLLSGVSPEARSYTLRLGRWIGFIFYYLWLLATSTLDVARWVFRDRRTMKPGIIALPLDAETDLEIVLLNSLLSMTPGTLGVDISPDRRVLYVHCINVPDPAHMKQSIKDGLERRLLQTLR